MTTMADEHPRGILLYSAHCVYNPSFSNFSYFFSSGLKTRAERLFPHPLNKSPHTEVNNINTYVSGVRAGALLKLIFQNVFLLWLQLQGSPPVWESKLMQGWGRVWRRKNGALGEADQVVWAAQGSASRAGTGLGQSTRDRSCLSAFLRKLSSCLPSWLHDSDGPPLRSSADALMEPRLELKRSTPQMQSHSDHGRTLCSLRPEGCPARAESPQGWSPAPRPQPPGTQSVSLRQDGCIRAGPRGWEGEERAGVHDLQAGGSWLKGVL